MLDAWAEEMSAEEADLKVRQLAYEIRKRKLELPATLFFESHRPLAYIGGQATFFFAPFLVPILGYQNVQDYARLLNRRDIVERLLQYLDKPMEELQSSPSQEVTP